MRAYSMDLRERALLDSDAGMKAADVAAKYRVSAVVLGVVGLITRIAENWGASREFELRYPFAFLARVTAASSFFAVVVALADGAIEVTPVRLIVLVMTGVVLFLVAFRLLGGLDREERRIIESSGVPLKRVILMLI